MAEIGLENIVKRFGDVYAVKNVDLTIEDGEFVVLVGPSGCGKSTTLRMVAGLEPVSSGRIRFGNRVVNALPPKARDIAMVFQSYALYPHMNVYANMAFGLKLKGMKADEIRRRVKTAAELLNIETLLSRKPRELSGGQRQRVAMGRAIVRQPECFLFDEPLSNLDASLRAQMRVEIKKLHHRLATTMIYVTHDQIEAMTLADRIVVMDHGEIVQTGAPMEVYSHPVNKFVAGFIGAPRMNFFPATLAEADDGGQAVVVARSTPLRLPRAETAYAPYLGREVELGIRPEHLAVVPSSRRERAAFEVTVEVVEPMGAQSLVVFDAGGTEGSALCEPGDAPKAGERVTLHADMSCAHIIDLATGDVVAKAPERAATDLEPVRLATTA